MQMNLRNPATRLWAETALPHPLTWFMFYNPPEVSNVTLAYFKILNIAHGHMRNIVQLPHLSPSGWTGQNFDCCSVCRENRILAKSCLVSVTNAGARYLSTLFTTDTGIE